MIKILFDTYEEHRFYFERLSYHRKINEKARYLTSDTLIKATAFYDIAVKFGIINIGTATSKLDDITSAEDAIKRAAIKYATRILEGKLK